MRRLFSLLALFRPLNLFLGALAVLISAAVLDALHQTAAIVKAVITVVALNAAANAFNDVRDLEADRINRANRPLPRGTISPRTALLSSVVLFGTGATVSLFLPPAAFVIAAFAAIPLMVAYSIWFKGWPLVGNVTIAAILGLTFIFAGVALGDPWGLLVPALLAFGFTVVRELIKDMADLEGDRAVRLKTFPVRYGMGPSVRLALVFIFLLCLGALIPYWLGIYGIRYLIVLVFGIEIPLVSIVFLLVKSASVRTCRISSQILKGCIFAGLLAVYLG
ncbi:MAG: geranylgeranylglycerol-phosphate geranylgeranyltransferase [Fidelibacterota bacterium]